MSAPGCDEAARPTRRTYTLRSLIVDEYTGGGRDGAGNGSTLVRTVHVQKKTSFQHVHALFARLLRRAGVRDNTVQCWEFPSSRFRRVDVDVAELEELAWQRMHQPQHRQRESQLTATPDEDYLNPASDVSEPCGEDEDIEEVMPPKPAREPPRPMATTSATATAITGIVRHVTIGQKRLMAMVGEAAAEQQQEHDVLMRLQRQRREPLFPRDRTASSAVHVVAGGSSLWLQIGSQQPSPSPAAPQQTAKRQSIAALPTQDDLSVELGAAWDDEFTSRMLCRML